MSKFLIPYTFVRGKRAWAEEINANFEAVKDELESINVNSSTKIGDLSQLSTDEKTDIVAALNEISDKANTKTRMLGEILTSTIPLTDAGLHATDGSVLLGDGIYADFVSYMGDLFYTLSDVDKEKCFTDEQTWQNEVASNGFCRKYVFDEINRTLRLPYIKPRLIMQNLGNVPVLGNGMTVGFSDGTYNYGIGMSNQDATAQRMFSQSTYGVPRGSNIQTPLNNNKFTLGLTSDSTKSGIIADLSNIKIDGSLYYYIVVGTSIKTDVQVNIDAAITDLNAKADKTEVAHLSMPSDRYEDWTLLASGNKYYAPADGYLLLQHSVTSNQYIQIQNGVALHTNWASSGYVSLTVKVNKSHPIIINYTANGTSNNVLRFIYAEGVK